MRSRIILHIGRNKAGSTSIQDACLASRDRLALQGIGYGLFGHLWDSDNKLPGWRTFDALADHALRFPERSWLVSNEFMSAWPTDYTREAERALRRCDVRIVAYVRRYDQWVRSAYAEDTRTGLNRQDIDIYLAHMRPRVSALPNLRDWAECFGWERMRVRSLDPADLVGADLLTDFAEAIGLNGPLAHVRPGNVAPHWIELEVIRALAGQCPEPDGTGYDRAIIRPLADLLRRIGGDPPDAPYLTADQIDGLLALYNADVETLGHHGQALTPIADRPTPRNYLPGLARIPDDIMMAFFEAAAAADFASALPEAAHAAARLAIDRRRDGAR